MLRFILAAVSFVLSLGSFGYGVTQFFHKRKPVYFLLVYCAIGCYALKDLSSVIDIAIGTSEGPIPVGLLGLFGSFCLLLCASFGQLDGMVDDGTHKKHYAIAALAPSSLLIAVCCGIMALWDAAEQTRLILISLLFIPALPASYFALKHLILPGDENGLLSSVRVVNLISLLFLAGDYLWYLFSFLRFDSFVGIISVLIGVLMVILAFSCRRAMRKWKDNAGSDIF